MDREKIEHNGVDRVPTRTTAVLTSAVQDVIGFIRAGLTPAEAICRVSAHRPGVGAEALTRAWEEQTGVKEDPCTTS